MTSSSLRAPRVLAVQNSEGSGIGRLLPWWEEMGLQVEVVPGAATPATPEGFDAVVLLGGGFLPDDDRRAPWLPVEWELTRRAVADGVPLLGICLGAQVLAAAVGGTVRGNHGRPERGSCPVSLRREAATDPLFAGLSGELRFIQNHRDQITELPPGVVRLAESEACPVQAFRVGECAWGVQFHPEAGADRLDRWDEAALAEAGLDLRALRAEAEQAEPQSARNAKRLAANFADLVRDVAGGPCGGVAGARELNEIQH
ncbi:type 1 glutamine amidotransferase [Actinoallomurus rhizosphaericola]|uniref:type 1 glutamine amidotransferase n=1 Tax=Actinoallomurus rhizosphaericola TaxID=2952536 RepID=UPI002093154E|nr:gamma-glutamyl-gamma-aminobutyrate hydrolase family protein [Actinoallomurus rhizosphaericola]MCO5999000.1 type 1 glutamine amidotransferase [Actinoallomurus rhizosphaericola]